MYQNNKMIKRSNRNSNNNAEKIKVTTLDY